MPGRVPSLRERQCWHPRLLPAHGARPPGCGSYPTVQASQGNGCSRCAAGTRWNAATAGSFMCSTSAWSKGGSRCVAFETIARQPTSRRVTPKLAAFPEATGKKGQTRKGHLGRLTGAGSVPACNDHRAGSSCPARRLQLQPPQGYNSRRGPVQGDPASWGSGGGIGTDAAACAARSGARQSASGAGEKDGSVSRIREMTR
jgi:hypothetical protein